MLPGNSRRDWVHSGALLFRAQEVCRALVMELTFPQKKRTERELWPPEVTMILSAMEATAKPASDGRAYQRLAYRVRAELKLFADTLDQAPYVLYTRDVDPRGLGFITPHRLPLGYGGWVELLTPRGRKSRIACTLYRCRQVVPGWYEGALYFNREQWMFTPED
jgi:hypothetical protein